MLWKVLCLGWDGSRKYRIKYYGWRYVYWCNVKVCFLVNENYLYYGNGVFFVRRLVSIWIFMLVKVYVCFVYLLMFIISFVNEKV